MPSAAHAGSRSFRCTPQTCLTRQRKKLLRHSSRTLQVCSGPVGVLEREADEGKRSEESHDFVKLLTVVILEGRDDISSRNGELSKALSVMKEQHLESRMAKPNRREQGER